MNDYDLPFRTVLYRYFFFGWLFREVAHDAPAFERGLTKHYNRRQAAWLPTYMLRWLWCSLLFYAFGGLIDIFDGSLGLSRCCYAASAMCVTFTITIATAWVGLTHRPDPA